MQEKQGRLTYYGIRREGGSAVMTGSPERCSGLAKTGVITRISVCVRAMRISDCDESTILAMPKSNKVETPFSLTRIFDGLMSLCMTRCRCKGHQASKPWPGSSRALLSVRTRLTPGPFLRFRVRFTDSLRILVLARKIDEYVTHNARCQSQQVLGILYRIEVAIQDAKDRLMNKSRCMEITFVCIATTSCPSNNFEILIDLLQQIIQCRRTSVCTTSY